MQSWWCDKTYYYAQEHWLMQTKHRVKKANRKNEVHLWVVVNLWKPLEVSMVEPWGGWRLRRTEGCFWNDEDAVCLHSDDTDWSLQNILANWCLEFCSSIYKRQEHTFIKKLKAGGRKWQEIPPLGGLANASLCCVVYRWAWRLQPSVLSWHTSPSGPAWPPIYSALFRSPWDSN